MLFSSSYIFSTPLKTASFRVVRVKVESHAIMLNNDRFPVNPFSSRIHPSSFFGSALGHQFFFPA